MTNSNAGPYYTFQKLVHDWKEERGLEPRQVAEKVKKFFAFYVSRARHFFAIAFISLMLF